MRTIALALLALPVLTGCAELRTEFAPQTGEPMQIFDHTTIQSGTQTVATGHDEIRDSTGRVVATSTHYQNQRVTWKERNWYPMQGGGRIDDESFYRITNDQDAAQRYDAYHRAGRSRSTAGIIAGSIGLALLAGGIGMVVADAPKFNPMTNMSSDRGALSYAGEGSILVGLITACVGFPLALAGRRAAKASDLRLLEEPERMKVDAQRYNAYLGAQPVR